MDEVLRLAKLTIEAEAIGSGGKFPAHLKRKLEESLRLTASGTEDTAIYRDGKVIGVLVRPENYHDPMQCCCQHCPHHGHCRD
jgi:hypothetical protein